MLYIVLIKMIVGSIIIAFVGSASTIVYLIMRKDVDGTEMDDIYVEENEDDVAAEEAVPEVPEEPVVQQAPPAPEPIVPSEQKKPKTTKKQKTTEKPKTTEEPPKEQ
jgi:outer membrane biosynthesis protein TonB